MKVKVYDIQWSPQSIYNYNSFNVNDLNTELIVEVPEFGDYEIRCEIFNKYGISNIYSYQTEVID